MSNIVAAAVGTQRQFTKQPVATYEKRLRQVNASNGIVNNGAGERLYRALTGLGDSLMRYAVGEEDRARADVVRVNKIVNSMSDEDMKTLKGMDLINKYGEYQLRDNPYAVAAIEQARGKYFSEKFNQQYSILQAQTPVKTEQEERQRYMEEKQKFLKENEGASYNLEGFYNGFWASNLQDVSNITNQKTAEISKSLRAISYGQITADLDTLVYDYSVDDKQDPEAFIQAAQAKFKEARIDAMQDDAKVKLGHDFVLSVAKTTGSMDLVNKLGELVISTNDDGTPILLKDSVAFDDIREVADQTQLAKPNKYTLGIMTKMAKCETQEQLDAVYNALPKQDQNRFKSAYAKQSLAITEGKQRAIRQTVSGQAQSLRQDENNLILDREYAKYVGNKMSAPTLSSMGIKQDALDEWASAKFQSIAQMPEGDARDKAVADLLYFPPNTTLRNSVGNMFMRALDTMSAEQMMNDGSAQGVSSAITLFDANPVTFRRNFGNDVANKVAALRAMQEGTGSLQTACTLFCKGRDAYADPDTRAVIDERVKALINDNGFNLRDIKTGEEAGFSYNTSGLLKANKWGLTYIWAAHPEWDSTYEDKGAAQVMAQLDSYLKKNYVSYDGAIIPTVFFSASTEGVSGINTTYADSDSYSIVKDYMDFVIANAPPGYNESNLGFYYDSAKQKMVLSSEGASSLFYERDSLFKDEWTLEEWYKKINEWQAKRQVEKMYDSTSTEKDESDEEPAENSVEYWIENNDQIID